MNTTTEQNNQKPLVEVVKLNTCVECDGVITNPLGEQRIVDQVVTWLAEKDIALAERFINEYEIYDNFVSDEEVMTNCVMTKRPMKLCMHCVAMQVVDWLVEVRASPYIIVRAFRTFIGDDENLFIKRLLQDQGLSTDDMVEQAAEFLTPLAATM